MIGMTLHDPASGITGIVDAVSVHADGKALARIADADGIEHWFDVWSLKAVK